MDTVFYVVAATEGLGLAGAIGAVALLRGRIGRLEARASDTIEQVMAVALEVQQMATAVTARLSEQQQSLDSSTVKPRRGRAVAAPAEVAPPPTLTSMQSRPMERTAYVHEPAAERVAYDREPMMKRVAYEREPIVERVAYEREPIVARAPYAHEPVAERVVYEREPAAERMTYTPEPSPRHAPPPHAAERMAEPVAVRSVRAALDASGPEIVMSDQDLARERGMDPLGVALQRQLVGHAARTA